MRKAPQHAAGIASLAVNKADPKVLQDFLALKYALSRRTAKAMIDGRSVWATSIHRPNRRSQNRMISNSTRNSYVLLYTAAVSSIRKTSMKL